MREPWDAHVVSAERVIAAPPEAIFDLLADASRHVDLDGSGQLRGVTSSAPERLSLGATFGMSMHGINGHLRQRHDLAHHRFRDETGRTARQGLGSQSGATRLGGQPLGDESLSNDALTRGHQVWREASEWGSIASRDASSVAITASKSS